MRFAAGQDLLEAVGLDHLQRRLPLVPVVCDARGGDDERAACAQAGHRGRQLVQQQARLQRQQEHRRAGPAGAKASGLSSRTGVRYARPSSCRPA